MSNNSTVVKTVAQKSGGTFDTFLPIGANAEHVSMKSQLNLEEELKLGGNKVTMVSISTFALDNQPATSMSFYKIRQYYSDDVMVVDSLDLQDARPCISSASRESINYTVETNLYTGGLITINPIQVGSDDTLLETQIPDYLADNNQRRIVSIQSQFADNPDASLIYISNIYNGYKSLMQLQNNYESLLDDILHQKKVIMTSSTYTLGG